ncbi:ABC-three component system protein [Acidimangrovimonas pyrenivorans]|uniref:ABC-three component system protein n=1 Tax=Acidimangrovimonas pyrenivorans TaxID=2030798 RepID=A0ABV7AC05_9RHOB
MTVSLQFKHMCGDKDSAALDIVFIHGLTGDPEGTWTNGEETFWPCWIADDLEGVCIYTAGYPSSLFEKWSKKEMDLHERASSLVEHMVSHGIGTRPVAFVCHSLGGLLAKEMLRAAVEAQDEDWNAIGQQLKLTIFMATPHKGAQLASILKFAFPRMSSRFIDTLSGDTGYVADLYNGYRDIAQKSGITTIAYYEKYKTKNVALVVSPDSADPGCLKTRPIAVDADHAGICKPASKEAPVFVSLLRHLKKALETCPMPGFNEVGSGLSPDDYSQKSEDDRRTLQEKLIDAGKEHEYATANNLQSKFARKYHRLGLFNEAKTKHDALLSAVEQRFLTHVFGPKICAGAPDAEVSAAVQEHVIDALCARAEFGVLSPTAVLQALYYLTEQCHIQWDKP